MKGNGKFNRKFNREDEILTKAEPGRCPSCNRVQVMPALGRCPSCNRVQVMPALMNTSKLQYCKLCGAASKGYKWLARFKEQPVNFLHPKADQ